MRAAANSGSAGDSSMSSAFSSACNCQEYNGPTVTATYTDEATVSESDRAPVIFLS